MGYKSFERKWQERRALERDLFKHRFDTPAKVKAFVEEQGRRADERLPGLYAARETQRANYETLKIVGGEPFEAAENALWETNRQIQYDEPWQQVRDCLAAGQLTIEITSAFVHFTSTMRRNHRICRLGPHDGLEFGETGQKSQLASMVQTARALLKRRAGGASKD